jgi:hypothetical protein
VGLFVASLKGNFNIAVIFCLIGQNYIRKLFIRWILETLLPLFLKQNTMWLKTITQNFTWFPPVVRVFALWSQAKFCATIFSHNVKFCLNGENWYFNFVSHKTMSNYDAYMCTNAEDHLVEYNSFHF